ncbi:MAG: molybdopterin-guanine dinucleotide biosynthesis protein B [Dehalococcoidales bacterium]|nr:molybdopterin-guanine dinucleotide biosynthesis protein B [Dehalococcoidales bacterium]
MVPIICVVGKSDAGKTTFLEKLIPELSRRGYRVGTVKHDVHGFDIDKPGKDSWKHKQAGSTAVVISSPEKLAIIKRTEREQTLDEIALLVGEDVDIILTEGFKRSNKPKIEISRREKGTELLCDERELVAVVADNDFDIRVPQFGLDDATGVADLLERRFLRRRSQDYATLLINGQRVPIKSFVQDVLDRTVRAIVSTLHGTEGAEEIVLVLRKNPSGGENATSKEIDSE